MLIKEGPLSLVVDDEFKSLVSSEHSVVSNSTEGSPKTDFISLAVK